MVSILLSGLLAAAPVAQASPPCPSFSYGETDLCDSRYVEIIDRDSKSRWWPVVQETPALIPLSIFAN